MIKIVGFNLHMPSYESYLFEMFLQSSMLVSQWVPLNPSLQMQKYPGTWFTHPPPFWKIFCMKNYEIKMSLPDMGLLHTHWYQSHSSFLCTLVDIDTDSHVEDHCSSPHSDMAFPCNHQYQFHSFFQSIPSHKNSNSHWSGHHRTHAHKDLAHIHLFQSHSPIPCNLQMCTIKCRSIRCL